MEKRKAHTSLQFFVILLALCPILFVPYALSMSVEMGLTFILFNVVVLILYVLIVFFYLRKLKLVWYNDTQIYLQTIIGTHEEKIPFSEVHLLREEAKGLIHIKGMGGRQFTLVYNSKEGIKTVRFYGSMVEDNTADLKKKLSERQTI